MDLKLVRGHTILPMLFGLCIWSSRDLISKVNLFTELNPKLQKRPLNVSTSGA